MELHRNAVTLLDLKNTWLCWTRWILTVALNLHKKAFKTVRRVCLVCPSCLSASPRLVHRPPCRKNMIQSSSQDIPGDPVGARAQVQPHKNPRSILVPLSNPMNTSAGNLCMSTWTACSSLAYSRLLDIGHLSVTIPRARARLSYCTLASETALNICRMYE